MIYNVEVTTNVILKKKVNVKINWKKYLCEKSKH